MQHEPRAYLLDILEACEAIMVSVRGIDFDAYKANREKRSAVEREFITIGEAMAVLRDREPALFDQVTAAGEIIDFRNQLTHGYKTINNAVVWGIALRGVPVLRRECKVLLDHLDASRAD